MVQSRFVTVESGDEVIGGLYAAASSGGLLELNLVVLVPGLDVVSEGVFTIFVERLGAEGPVFVHPNGDVVLLSRGFVEEGGESFVVSVSPPIGESHMVGAVVRVGSEFEGVVGRFLRKRSG